MSSRHYYHKRVCSKCGREWQARNDYEPKTTFCNDCVTRSSQPMEKNFHWKGGRRKAKGYWWIKVAKDDPFYAMTNNHGYIAEHRLVVAKYLGRCLTREEQVHHKDWDKENKSIPNLFLTDNTLHPRGYREGYKVGYKTGYKKGFRAGRKGNKGM